MPTTCALCKGAVTPTVPAMKCASCRAWFHIKCINISKAQFDLLKCADGLEYNCTSCRNSVNTISNAGCDCRKIIPELKAIIDSLKVTVEGLKSEIMNAPKTPINNTTKEIIAEVIDRQRRTQNIMFYGFPEQPESLSATERKANDKNYVADFLEFVSPSDANIVTASIVNCSRVGKFNQASSRPRPIKICVKDPSLTADTLRIIRANRNRILQNRQFKRISASNDQTPLQSASYRKIKAELNARTAAGENGLSIKFINDVPRIINTNSSVNNSNN